MLACSLQQIYQAIQVACFFIADIFSHSLLMCTFLARVVIDVYFVRHQFVFRQSMVMQVLYSMPLVLLFMYGISLFTYVYVQCLYSPYIQQTAANNNNTSNRQIWRVWAKKVSNFYHQLLSLLLLNQYRDNYVSSDEMNLPTAIAAN